MNEAPLPLNEFERLRQLKELRILDTPPEMCFDEIVKLAADICQTPMALISLVDQDRQWFKAKIGLSAKETSRKVSFCAHAIQKESMFYIPNTHKDKRFADNPLVTGNPKIHFYAGYPIKSPGGMLLGTLCVLDQKPRRLNKEQKHALKVLAGQVSSEIRIRSLLHRQEELIEYLERRENRLNELHQFLFHFLGILGHDLRSPIAALKQVVDHCANHNLPQEMLKEHAIMLNVQLEDLLELLSALMQWSLHHYQAGAIEKQRISLAPLIQEKIAYWQPSLEAKKLKIFYETNQEFAISAPGVAEIVLSNVLHNAIKFSPEGGEIFIEANATGIRVEDEGPEMSEEQIHNAFVWSKSGAGNKRGKVGMGLGLKICRELMRHLGGDLVLKQRENGQPGIRAEMIFFT